MADDPPPDATADGAGTAGAGVVVVMIVHDDDALTAQQMEAIASLPADALIEESKARKRSGEQRERGGRRCSRYRDGPPRPGASRSEDSRRAFLRAW